MENRKEPPTFILLGAAGYVAPRHLSAIKEIGGELVAAVDPCTSAGILDHFFPKCRFYRSYLEAFAQTKADYAVICTPNHDHAEQSEVAMRCGMNVIVEKPAAIKASEVDQLIRAEAETGRRVNCILNMRLHHDAKLLCAISRQFTERAIVDVEYHTPRGEWYEHSWKFQPERSGGILFNIGIHLLDLSLCAFGPKVDTPFKWTIRPNAACGTLHFPLADVFVRLSINGHPKQRTFVVNGAEFDFTNGFENLHTESYRRILSGKGFGLKHARAAVALCEELTQHAS